LFDLGASVPLVCAPSLTALYARALAAYDVKATAIDGDQASLSGLILAHAEIFS
jgi:2-keto-3-deoxy-galactonokinase